MGGLNCYTMCTSPKQRSTSRTNPRRRERPFRMGWERIPLARRLCIVRRQLESPLRLKALRHCVPCGKRGWTAFGLKPLGILCDELRVESRTAIGPQPNVTVVRARLRTSTRLGSLEYTATFDPQQIRPSRGDAHTPVHAGRNTPREGIVRAGGRPLRRRSRRSFALAALSCSRREEERGRRFLFIREPASPFYSGMGD